MMEACSPGTRDRCVVARSDSLAGRRRWQGFVPKSLSSKCNNRPPASWFMTAGRSICSKVDSLTLQATPESRRKYRTARQSKPTNRDGLAHVGFAPRHALALPASVRHFLEHSKCVFRLRKRGACLGEPGCRLPTKGSTRSYGSASPLRLCAVPVARKPRGAYPLLIRFLIQDADVCPQI
jgi:hypothetical protein